MPNEFPESIETEKKLISAMWLKNGLIIPDIANIVKAADFYRPEHRVIYEATVAVYERGTPPNPLLIEEELRRRDKLKFIDTKYLLGLVDAEYSTARATTYAKTIRELSKRRQIIDLNKEMIACAGEECHSMEELIGINEQITTVLMSTANEQPWGNMENLIKAGAEVISARRGKQGLQGARTGLHDLDEMTGGLKKSDLIILAARPSMGKTALAMNIALAAARDVPVLVFSLEMSKAQLVDRLISSVSGVNLKRILDGELSKDEMSRIFDVLPEMEKRKLSIDDTGGLRISELKMRARQYKHENGLGLIVVDYLQLVQSSKAYIGNRVNEVSEVSRELKALAKELDVPVLALSQLSRNLEMRADRRPQLSDLRESGSIEQDADIVMFLYRDEYYNRDSEEQNIAEIIIAKNRNGPIGFKRFQFDKEIVRFRCLTRREN